MNNRKSTPLVDGVFGVWWPSRFGHTMVLGRTGSGKGTCDVWRLAFGEARPVLGKRDTLDAGDDACA
jgi:hypothetical protein